MDIYFADRPDSRAGTPGELVGGRRLGERVDLSHGVIELAEPAFADSGRDFLLGEAEERERRHTGGQADAQCRHSGEDISFRWAGVVRSRRSGTRAGF